MFLLDSVPCATTTCEWHVYAWGLRYFPDELGRLKAPRKFPGHVIRIGLWLVDPAHKQIYMVTLILHAGTNKKRRDTSSTKGGAN